MASEVKPLLGDDNHYNSITLKQHTVAQLRKEYRRYRREAKERLKELKQEGFENSRIVQNKEYLQKDPSTLRKQDLVNYLTYAHSFVNAKTSTVEGQKAREDKVIQKFQDLGYSNIKKETLDEFGKFMDKSRNLFTSKILASDIAVVAYDMAKENNISIANLEKNLLWYAEHLDDIENLDLSTNRKRAYTKTQLERAIKKKQEKEQAEKEGK